MSNIYKSKNELIKLQFVNLADLNYSQINQIAQLMFETGYYDYVSFDNKLNLPPIPFQIEQTLLPCAKYTHVLTTCDGSIIGFYIAATKHQALELKQDVTNWYSDKFDVRVFQKKLFHYYLYETNANDFILHECAIDVQWRGKGLFWALYEEICKIAIQQNCTRIIFAVWKSKPELNMYLHCGAKIIGEIDFSHLGFKDSLIKCYFEL